MNIHEVSWEKVWATEYSLFSLFLFGREYTRTCEEALGIGFTKILFSCEQGIATLYRCEKEQRAFARFLASRSLNEKEFSTEIASKLAESCKRWRSFLLINREFPTEEFFSLHAQTFPYYLTAAWAPESFAEVEVDQGLKNKVYQDYSQARKESQHLYSDIERWVEERITEKLPEAKKGYARYLFPKELKNYFMKKELPNEEMMNERQKGYFIYCTPENTALVSGREYRRLVNELMDQSKQKPKIIQGIIAEKGVVEGCVRLVSTLRGLDPISQNDIVVSAMIRPEWIPNIKEAAAFVTDVGGILSHVAIIARDLKKPCITGTKLATSVLKEGDWVLVDANQGIVRILRRTHHVNRSKFRRSAGRHPQPTAAFS